MVNSWVPGKAVVSAYAFDTSNVPQLTEVTFTGMMNSSTYTGVVNFQSQAEAVNASKQWSFGQYNVFFAGIDTNTVGGKAPILNIILGAGNSGDVTYFFMQTPLI